MENNEHKKWIKESHVMGWNGILMAYPLRGVVRTKAFIVSLILSIAIFLFALFSNKNFTELLTDLSSTNTSLFPNLLGFNVGGYAIIVGFSNIDLIKSMIRPQKNKKYSLFQETSSIFAFSIIIQSIVLISSFAIYSIHSFSPQNPFGMLDLFSKSIDFACIFLFPVLLFLTVYAMVLLPFIVINVFTFGQMNHAYMNLQEVESKEKDEK